MLWDLQPVQVSATTRPMTQTVFLWKNAWALECQNIHEIANTAVNHANPNNRTHFAGHDSQETTR
jgi:hypothetical protein